MAGRGRAGVTGPGYVSDDDTALCGQRPLIAVHAGTLGDNAVERYPLLLDRPRALREPGRASQSIRSLSRASSETARHAIRRQYLIIGPRADLDSDGARATRQ